MRADPFSVYSVVDYLYDANGARTNMLSIVDDASSFVTNRTVYTYDEDNRLVEVQTGAQASSLQPHSTFAYDYRSRRYYRNVTGGATPEETYHVFDGGLAVQEYDATQSLTPNAQSLKVEFIRGEGMGGGVGGMVYSIRNGNIICSHANHRGDIIARSNFSGSLTSFALYEAYGTRPYEWGDDPDRQKANTKDEETDLGLLNEGMRYRDLETGTFMTRDPIGFADGPNVYCYVHCNPITSFDPLGLSINVTRSYNPDTKVGTINIVLEAVLINESSDDYYQFSQKEMDGMVAAIKTQIEATFTGEEKSNKGTLVYNTTVNMTVASSAKEIGENDHVFRLVDNIPDGAVGATDRVGRTGQSFDIGVDENLTTNTAPPRGAEAGGGSEESNP